MYAMIYSRFPKGFQRTVYRYLYFPFPKSIMVWQYTVVPQSAIACVCTVDTGSSGHALLHCSLLERRPGARRSEGPTIGRPSTIARGPRASPETTVYCTQISTLARVDDALELPLLRASVSAFCEGDHG